MNTLAIGFEDEHDVVPMARVGAGLAIVGGSGALKSVMEQVEQVAATTATVLLLGETGTGKGLIARAIHERSLRRQHGLVVVDCGALPPTLIESELFGRERGAYTDAYASQAGRFELAHGGTIFLDEIGELPLVLQAKLLRVLQEGIVERLGSPRTVRVDVRIIAATNRNLADDVRTGRFRRDLFYRLNVFPITVPALRHRIEDLPALVSYLARQLGRRLGKPIARITPGSLPALMRYHWPGNIRELENVLQQAIIVSGGDVLDLSSFTGEPLDLFEPLPSVADRARTLRDVRRDHMTRALDRTGWRIEGRTGAARLLGVPPSTLRSQMRKLGIHRPLVVDAGAPETASGETACCA